MKKLMLLMLVMALGLGLQAQDADRRQGKGQRGDGEKFESMKIAHLTNALDLTPEVAEKFWPVYNKWNNQKKELRRANRPEKKIEDMTEAEADTFIENTLASRKKANELDEGMLEDLKSVLSASQRMKLIKDEENFHQSIVKRFKKKRKGAKGENKSDKSEKGEEKEN